MHTGAIQRRRECPQCEVEKVDRSRARIACSEGPQRCAGLAKPARSRLFCAPAPGGHGTDQPHLQRRPPTPRLHRARLLRRPRRPETPLARQPRRQGPGTACNVASVELKELLIDLARCYHKAPLTSLSIVTTLRTEDCMQRLQALNFVMVEGPGSLGSLLCHVWFDKLGLAPGLARLCPPYV